jgi:xanthine dehydrogenase iron-sulfur cluster and FAD-binding subunit A
MEGEYPGLNNKIKNLTQVAQGEFGERMWNETITVNSLDEAVRILHQRGEAARIVAGATDLILEIERGVRKGVDTLIDISRVPDLDKIALDEDGMIHLGAMVTHGQCAASKLIIEQAFPLARAAWEVGAAQIRNRGTVAGNLITASPANDTIPALMAMGAEVLLRSVQGERIIPLEQFYTGVRRTVMHPDEVMVDIRIPGLKPDQRGTFVKLGLRRAQAISVVNAAVVLTFDERKVTQAVITLGSVAPTIIHAKAAEKALVGKKLDANRIQKVAQLAQQSSQPIDDIRGGKDYRQEMVRVCVQRALLALAQGEERRGYPERPVTLRIRAYGAYTRPVEPITHTRGQEGPVIVTQINGKEYRIRNASHKTLLRMLREDAGLTGTKEGCAEGECGACTVWMDGMAVMSCLVPAARAHNAHITTIEGLEQDGQLDPMQQAFIDQGAVQCGYCTPGFIMSAAMLLKEIADPTVDEIKAAISGNLCRCTGYYSIVAAIEQAARKTQTLP